MIRIDILKLPPVLLIRLRAELKAWPMHKKVCKTFRRNKKQKGKGADELTQEERYVRGQRYANKGQHAKAVVEFAKAAEGPPPGFIQDPSGRLLS